MAQRIRAAVVGCGPIGVRHAEAAARHAGTKVVGVCDRDPERAAALGQRLGVRAWTELAELLTADAPDVVFVATPDHLHAEPVIAALDAGCHVFCEKPLATSLADGRAMVAASERAGKRFGLDYNRRFGFGYREAKRLLETGTVGDISHAVIQVTDHIPPFRRGPYTQLYLLMVHHLDLLRWLCGEIVSVHARCARPDSGGCWHETMVSVAFESGALGLLSGGWREGQTRTDERTQVNGPLGAVIVDNVQREVRWHGLDPDSWQARRPDYFQEGRVAFYDSLVDHVHAFLDAVLGDAPVPIPARDGLRTLELIDAAIRSHESGTPVETGKRS